MAIEMTKLAELLRQARGGEGALAFGAGMQDAMGQGARQQPNDLMGGPNASIPNRLQSALASRFGGVPGSVPITPRVDTGQFLNGQQDFPGMRAMGK